MFHLTGMDKKKPKIKHGDFFSIKLPKICLHIVKETTSCISETTDWYNLPEKSLTEFLSQEYIFKRIKKFDKNLD